MKFILLFFIILASVFSIQVEAQDPFLYGAGIEPEASAFIPKLVKYSEPTTVNIEVPTRYYKKAYGYNTKDACIGRMCLQTGEQVGCEYSYNNGGTPGTQVQICSIKTRQRPNGAVEDVSKKNLMFVTGLINDKKEFIKLPDNEILYAKLSFGKWKIKQFEPAPVISNATLNAGVCPSGNCDVETDPCKTKSVFSDISCLGKAVMSIPEAVFGGGESEYVDPTFSHKKIADAFVIGNGNTHFAPSCSNFIDKSGHMGSRGKKVLEAIKKAGPDWFYGGPDCCKTRMRTWDPYSGKESSAMPKPVDVSAVCPNFNSFTQKQKEYFWIWVFAAMANDESTCGLKSDNPRNPRTCGLLQMEKNRKKNRDSVLCNPQADCRRNESFQMECSASIIRDFSSRFDFPLTAPGSYWEKLRGNKSVARHIRLYPGCN